MNSFFTRKAKLNQKVWMTLTTLFILAFFGLDIVVSFGMSQGMEIPPSELEQFRRFLQPFGVMALAVVLAQYLPIWNASDASREVN